MINICIINGPNLNLLGTREPDIYGIKSLEQIMYKITNDFSELNIKHFQSNHEGQLIDYIQENMHWAHGIVINPAAFGHTSIAIRDTLLSSKLPVVETHLSNINNREEFRRKSFISDICIGQICGFKDYSYHLALFALINYLKN
jgi:3-dehydroquinate dehydratase II